MATRNWLGAAPVVSQVATVQITADDASTTYTITIGGIAVSVAGAGTGVNDTATALEAALTAAGHPYFTDLGYSVATDTVTISGNANGAPFTATSSVNGGTGTIGAVTTTTTAESPNHWALATNWSGNTAPVNSDTVIIAGATAPILWNLDQSSLALDELHIRQSYTGFIGHNPYQFTTGPATAGAAAEYRDLHLAISCPAIHVGAKGGAGTQQGSGRLNLDNRNTGTPICYVYNTASNPKDSDSVAFDYLVSDAQASLFVAAAPGGVGVAVKDPTSTAQLDTVSVDGTDPSTKVFIGAGVTLDTLQSRAGMTRVLGAAADIATLRQFGGTVETYGEGYEITDADIYSGTLDARHTDATRVFGALDLWDGALADFTRFKHPRTIASLVIRAGGKLRLDSNLTITALSIPAEDGVLAFDR